MAAAEVAAAEKLLAAAQLEAARAERTQDQLAAQANQVGDSCGKECVICTIYNCFKDGGFCKTGLHQLSGHYCLQLQSRPHNVNRKTLVNPEAECGMYPYLGIPTRYPFAYLRPVHIQVSTTHVGCRAV